MKKVFLKPRFNWTVLHSLYNDLIQNPPENYKIETLNGKQGHSLTTLGSSKARNYFYKTLFYHLGGLPFTFAKTFEHSVKFDNYDLIYASQHVIKTEQPWIVDLEYANGLSGYLDLLLCKKIISKRLKSKSCKAILPWSNWAAETLRNSIDCKDFEEKIKVLRYTVSPKKISNIRKKNSSIRILFLGSMNPSNVDSFEFKGLYETLDAFIELQKKYDNLELIIRSLVTPEIKEKARKYSNIKILEKPLNPSKLEELYQSTDIFPHAGFEVLNLSVLEAMSYGIPVIATSLYNTPELIKHMNNGILIDLPDPHLFYTKNKAANDYSRSFLYSMRKLRPYMKEKLIENMKLLIEDSSLREKISREAASTIEEGEFSVKHRNNILKEIFDKAIS